ncbi:MAG: acyltransferase family protein [Candidatus Helarchaeota archaeon]
MNNENYDMVDYRIELAKFISIVIVVILHLLVITQWFIEDNWFQTWPVVFAIGCFMYCSGYVHGLKNEFTKPSDVSPSKYFSFLKKRFTRLYIGYYIGLILVLIVKLILSYPITITTWTIFLDITGFWPLIVGDMGGIWPYGWFVCSIFMLNIIYPFIKVMKRRYLALIIGLTVFLRIFVFLSAYPEPAYYFPFSWLTEFSVGILFGDNRRRQGKLSWKHSQFNIYVIKMGKRIWPLYLVHIPPILFLPLYPSLWECLIVIFIIAIMTEILYHSLNKIYLKILV